MTGLDADQQHVERVGEAVLDFALAALDAPFDPVFRQVIAHRAGQHDGDDKRRRRNLPRGRGDDGVDHAKDQEHDAKDELDGVELAHRVAAAIARAGHFQTPGA